MHELRILEHLRQLAERRMQARVAHRGANRVPEFIPTFTCPVCQTVVEAAPLSKTVSVCSISCAISVIERDAENASSVAGELRIREPARDQEAVPS